MIFAAPVSAQAGIVPAATAVQNNCSVRVWLHQYTNYVNHGWALCISPHGPQVIIPNQHGHGKNIQISSNTAACQGSADGHQASGQQAPAADALSPPDAG
jgi:hypothetical protein